MILETPRLTLRPLTLADAETAYHGWTADAEANKWVSWLPHNSHVAGGHAKENPASAKVLLKLGFVYDRDGFTSHVDGIRVFDSLEYYLDLEDTGYG